MDQVADVLGRVSGKGVKKQLGLLDGIRGAPVSKDAIGR